LPEQFGWPAAVVAVLVAFVTGLFTAFAARSKSASEIEVAVLAEWQKLNAALSDRVTALEKELSDVRRANSNELDEMRNKHRAEMRALRDLNEGLQRQIAQNSQSTVHLMDDDQRGRKP
jgi:flagellar motility protein MotE (MotC chaperone)